MKTKSTTRVFSTIHDLNKDLKSQANQFRHLAPLHHPHLRYAEIVNKSIGIFEESSPLRKLFKSLDDFDFCIHFITHNGPPHECFNTGLLLRQAEELLRKIEKDVELLPINDGIDIAPVSPHHSPVQLPLKYPINATMTTVDIDTLSFFLAEGPIERILSNTLFATVHYYLEIYVEFKNS